MNSKKLYIWTSFVAAAILVFFAVATLFDLKVSEVLYARDNAFGKIYEAIGKAPAFVLSAFACFVLGRNAEINEKKKAKTYLFYIFGYVAGTLTFLDFGEMLFSSKLFALALGAVLSVPLTVTVYAVTKRIDGEKLAAMKKWALVVLFSVALTAVIVYLLKTIWGRARYVDTQTGDAMFTPWYRIERTGGDSFPSGHSAFAASFFLLLPLCGIDERLKDKEKQVFLVALAFVVVTMLARISDGHHYLSDVTIGFGIAFFIQAIVIAVAYGKKLDKQVLDGSNKLERLLDAVF